MGNGEWEMGNGKWVIAFTFHTFMAKGRYPLAGHPSRLHCLHSLHGLFSYLNLAEDFVVISLQAPEPPIHDPAHDRPPPMPPPSIDDVPLIIPPQEEPPILPPDDDPGPVHEPPVRKH